MTTKPHKTDDIRDAIEAYFDNQIGIIEKEVVATIPQQKKDSKVATGNDPDKPPHQFSILDIIESRNEYEESIGVLIKEFEEKILKFFDYIKQAKEGTRLMVKINSFVPENEIYDDFAKIYRKYKALYRKTVGDMFFKETEELLEKLCDDFESVVRRDT